MAAIKRHALRGRIVTMDRKRTVLADGVVYVRGDSIAAVAPASAPPPDDFAKVTPQKTNGTVYPGLIDLHNHLAYNILTLWDVPKLYTNRDQWGDHPDYRRLISGPLNVLGRTKGYPEAIARYTECKCLLGGVTTSQGIKLASNSDMSTFYKGFLRNPEVSEGEGFPAAHARIADVAAHDRETFLTLLKHSTSVLLHLSEGTDARARAHFESLCPKGVEPALAKSLAGIHCVALKATDFRRMKAKGASMVWSPLSNLLLYGQTADIVAAKKAGVRMGLGADWAPSGSKNLLGEMKVAYQVARHAGNVFSDADIVAMATSNAAGIIAWDTRVGSLEAGKRADLIVVRGRDKAPYLQLLEANESDIVLVLIDGVRRYGLRRLMGSAAKGETCKVGGSPRLLDLSGVTTAPLKPVSLKAATKALQTGLRDLVKLAEQLEHPRSVRALAQVQPEWTLELEEEEPAGTSLRPRFFDEEQGIAMPKRALGMEALGNVVLSELLEPMMLDKLTAVDDKAFVKRISSHPNVPLAIRKRLAKAFAR
jgi:cytosine/adenosine deaminase-related metal-dependent hydrolase